MVLPREIERSAIALKSPTHPQGDGRTHRVLSGRLTQY